MLYIGFNGEKNFLNFFLVLNLVGTSIDCDQGGGGRGPAVPGHVEKLEVAGIHEICKSVLRFYKSIKEFYSFTLI